MARKWAFLLVTFSFSGLANANSEYDYYDSDFEPWTQPSKEVPNPALDVVTTESATGKLVIIAPVSTEEFKPPALTTEESITETYWEYFYDYGDSTVIVERVPTTTTVAPSTTTEPVAPVSSSSTIKQTTSVKNTNPPITSRAERLTPTTVTVPSADFEDEDVTETTIALTTSTKKAKTQPTTTAAPAIDEDDEFILTTETPKSKISLKSPSASTRTSSDTWPVVTNSKRTTTKIPKATPRTTRTTSTTTAAPFVEYDYEYEEFITEAPTTTTTTTTTTATPTKTKIKDLKEYLKRKALEREMRTSTEDPFLAILATIDPAILLKDSSTRFLFSSLIFPTWVIISKL